MSRRKLKRHIIDVLQGEKTVAEQPKTCFCGKELPEETVQRDFGEESVKYCSEKCADDHEEFILTGKLPSYQD